MIFRTATTSQKLNFLAALIEGKFKKVFNQWTGTQCTVALGIRTNGAGVLRPASVLANTTTSEDKQAFAAKFGVTIGEATALYVADYDVIDARFSAYGEKTPKRAANALRALARKYARQGK